MDIVVTKPNDVYLKISADKGILAEISEEFTYDVPGAKFSRNYINKFWDGKKRLFDKRGNKLPAGLAKHLADFAGRKGYSIDLGDIDVENPLSIEETFQFVKSLNIHSKNNKIKVRDYQLLAFRKGIQEKRIILVSPTSSGKSVIIYCIIRYLQTLISQKNQKIVLVVPRQSLVEQMYKDFKDYSSHDNSWNVEDNCHRIYAGHAKTTDLQVIITTWHSLKDLPPLIFSSTFAIIADETHGYKSDLLTDLFSKFKTTSYRIGTTGTLQDAKAHKLVLEGTFGPAYKVISIQKLTKDKKVAKAKINCLVLHHNTNEEFDYDGEIKYLMAHEKRNKFIRNLAFSLKGNTLILLNYIDGHLIPLVEDLKKNNSSNRDIFVIHGGIKVKEREEIREKIETLDNCITVASGGTFSEGTNVNRIHNIITVSSNQSKIRVLQTIGRGLRIGEDKQELNLYDLADKFPNGNITYRHYLERLRLYNAEGHIYKEYKIRID